MKLSASLVMLFALALLGFVPNGASAESAHEACAGDAKKYCNGVQPGDGRLGVCLNEHRRKLSSGCRDWIKKTEKGMDNFWGDCAADIRKRCSGVEHGDGRLIVCLQQHKTKISSRCRRSLENLTG